MRKINYVPNMCDTAVQTEHALHFNVAAVQTESPLQVEATTQTKGKKLLKSGPGSAFTLNGGGNAKEQTYGRQTSARVEEDQLISEDSSEESADNMMAGHPGSQGVSKNTTQLELEDSEWQPSSKDFSLQEIETFAKKMVPVKQSRFKKYSKEKSLEAVTSSPSGLNRQSSLLSFGQSPHMTPKLGPKPIASEEELIRMGKQMQSLVLAYKEVLRERDTLRGTVKTMVSNKIADRIKSKFLGGSSTGNLMSPTSLAYSRPSSPKPIILLPPMSPSGDDPDDYLEANNKHLIRVRKSNMVRASAREIKAIPDRKEVDVKVVKQAKFRKNHQIRVANKLMTSFLDAKNNHSNLNISCMTAPGTVKQINNIYQAFFSDVKEKKENLTLRLFIYTFKFYSVKTSDTIAEGNFRKLLRSLQVHQKNPRVILFSGFLGLRNTLDVHSFQIFYEMWKYMRDRQ